MAKIKNDLVGVVLTRAKGKVVALRAGDTVPRGVKLGAHVLDSPPRDSAAASAAQATTAAESAAEAGKHGAGTSDD